MNWVNIALIICFGVISLYFVVRVISTAIYVSKWRVRDWWIRTKKSKKEEKNDASRP
jgi:hypothetical protein